MLRPFIDFAESVLPSVSPDFRDGAKNAILQFEKTGEQIKFLMQKPLEKFSQGDILLDLPFSLYDENGKIKQYKANAMVLSTSCDIDRKKHLLFVPLLPVSIFSGNKEDLFSNQIFDYMYTSLQLLDIFKAR